MRYLNRYINAVLLAAALVAPVAIMAAPRPQVGVQVRVYDRNHHDYHNWDDREDHAYRGYLVAQHRTYREYGHQSVRVQSNYWNWRHSHPDHD